MECPGYDGAVWFAVREMSAMMGGPLLPYQDFETWVREQAASRSRDRIGPQPLNEQEHCALLADVAEALRCGMEQAVPATASAIDELRDLLRRAAGEAPGRDPGIATYTAWAIDHEDRLEGLDRADAHRRLGLAVAHAKRLHGRTVAS